MNVEQKVHTHNMFMVPGDVPHFWTPNPEVSPNFIWRVCVFWGVVVIVVIIVVCVIACLFVCNMVVVVLSLFVRGCCCVVVCVCGCVCLCVL